MCPPTGPTVHHSPVKEATTMVVVGADVHKRTHTFVAVDEVGQQARPSSPLRPRPQGITRRWRGPGSSFGAELRVGDRGLPASVGPVGAGSVGRRSAGGAGAAEDDGAELGRRRGPGASPIRSMRWPWRGRCCGNRTCRWPRHDEVSRELKLLVDRREVLGGATGLARSTACCGGSMNWTRRMRRSPGHWTWPSTSRLLRALVGDP